MTTFLTKAWKQFFGATYSIVYVESPTKKQPILEFDSIEECSIQATSEIVEYPIETGTKITDYKYDNPDIIVVKGVIAKGSATNQLVSMTGLVDNQVGLINRTEEALQKFKKGIYHLDIQTKYKLYTNYTLKDFSRTENLENYSLYEVEMTFKQIMTNKKYSAVPASSVFEDTLKSGIVKLVNLI